MSLIPGSVLVVILLSGCGDSDKVIPLVQVDTPPPLPAQDKSDIKSPKGASPSVLPE